MTIKPTTGVYFGDASLKYTSPTNQQRGRLTLVIFEIVGRGGAMVESKPFDPRVVGSNLALTAT